MTMEVPKPSNVPTWFQFGFYGSKLIRMAFFHLTVHVYTWLVMCKGWANPRGSRVRVRGFVKGQGVSRDFYSSNYKVL